MGIDLAAAIAGMTLVTYLTRSLFTVFISEVRIPPFWNRALSFVPLAVLTALVSPYLAAPSGPGPLISTLNPYLIAGCVTLLLARWSRNLLVSAITGTALFLILTRFLLQ
ncbi:MAG: AzlD domain-containing protein [bacterium]|nr:MAG: AzlD domain-containing protein [bacterium]